MFAKRRGVLIVGIPALCFAVILPARLGDSRLPLWKGLIADARVAFQIAVDDIRGALPFSRRLPKAELAANPPAAAPSDQAASDAALERPDVTQDAAVANPDAAPLDKDKLNALGIDPTGIAETLADYRTDNLAAGDSIAQRLADPIVRTALEWVALRELPLQISQDRLLAFTKTHPDWPAAGWFRHQMEARMLQVKDPLTVEYFFTQSAPETAIGKLALAKALKATGRIADGTKLARAVFRESDTTPFLETKIKADFGADLTKGDYKYRADRLMYKEQVVPALRYAAQAGPDVLALEKARAAIIAEAPSDKAFAEVPEAYRKDPGFLLAQVQKLRRDGKLMDAANLMQTTPREPAQLIDGDAWWTERRVLARKLLDDGRVNAAYVICATHTPASDETTIEAEFHAGWIALRFMKEPSRAAYHFAAAAKLAETPTSIARIAYWQGRTAEQSAAPDAIRTANTFFRKAAEFGSTYYGQLAREALGATADLVKQPSEEAVGADRVEAVRVIELLYAAGEKASATTLAVEAAKNLSDYKQVAALAAVIAHQQDAHLALTIGKLIGQRGIAADKLAFPTYGIPAYDPLQDSAPLSVVYSVARQESAFIPNVVSKAGAKGLMQMIDATARHTATKAGLPFDGNRLLNDASFNARLGAAHLGELLAEQNGSFILTFAAYNAGGGKVKEWIDAYGDPRKPGVDTVDWVERIPFTETRNYVQRVIANVTVYDALFADEAKKKTVAKADREAKL